MLRQKCLRIIYNDKHLSFKELLEKIRERIARILGPEMYKVSNNFSPAHMNEIFEIRIKHPYIVPNVYKNIDGLDKFKKAVKNGNLRVILVQFVRRTLQMSVLYREPCMSYLLIKH